MITAYAIEYGYEDDRRFMPEAFDLDAAHSAAKFLRSQGLAPTVYKVQVSPDWIKQNGGIVGKSTEPGTRPQPSPKVRTGLT